MLEFSQVLQDLTRIETLTDTWRINMDSTKKHQPVETFARIKVIGGWRGQNAVNRDRRRHSGGVRRHQHRCPALAAAGLPACGWES
jgi:hypothetical protein